MAAPNAVELTADAAWLVAETIGAGTFPWVLAITPAVADERVDGEQVDGEQVDGAAARSEGPVAILGAGVMGETLLSGLLRSGRPVESLVVSERRPERVTELTERYGVRVVDNATAAAEASTVVLVVKPQDMASALADVRPALRPGTLVVSLAAGITRTIDDLLRAAAKAAKAKRAAEKAST